MQISYYVSGLIFLCCLFAQPAQGQTGNCESGEAETFLVGGDVRARIFNNGNLFWGGSPHVYTVPKDGPANAIFAANIWVAGYIEDKLHGAGSLYGPWEFWPGPIDENGNPPEKCSDYDNIWEINYADLLAYIEQGIISDNLRDWPWQLGAPVIDGDGNPNNYNLAGGDIPELLGHQRLWWVMNDRGNRHEHSRGTPIGLEVQASAYAFDLPSFIGNDTFYKFRLINKNTAPLTDAYFGFWVDVDFGNFDDDYAASDSMLHLGYFLNADNDDEGREGYGAAPPAIGFTYIDSAISDNDGFDNDRDGEIDEAGEKIGTSSVLMMRKSCCYPVGPAEDLQGHYNYMRGTWQDASPLYEGGSIGYLQDDWPTGLEPKQTRFSFPGNPVSASFWSQYNIDNQGTVQEPFDQRFLVSSGPFDIAAGDTQDVALAIVWARGESNLDSVTELKKEVRSIRSAADALLSTSNDFVLLPLLGTPPPPPQYALGFDQNFPNPFAQSTTLRYSLPQTMQVKLDVYDILGRQVDLLVDAQQNAGIYTIEFDAGNLPAGVYLARIELDHLRFTKRMMLIR